MITLKELQSGFTNIPINHEANLELLLDKLNIIRQQYGKPLRVTSGYRSEDHHIEIYRRKGITDARLIPMKSNHLIGRAADLCPIEDDIKHFQDWIMNNIHIVEDCGLYMEAFAYTPTWVHFQDKAPASGNRFFKP